MALLSLVVLKVLGNIFTVHGMRTMERGMMNESASWLR